MIGSNGPTTQSSRMLKKHMWIMYPTLDKVVFSEHGKVGTKVSNVIRRHHGNLGGAQGSATAEAMLDLSDDSVLQLQTGQYRLDLIEFLEWPMDAQSTVNCAELAEKHAGLQQNIPRTKGY